MRNKPVAPRTGLGTARPAWMLSITLVALLFTSALPIFQPGSARAEERAVPSTQEIMGAKAHVADVYDAYLHGRADQAELRAAEDHVSDLTGERVETTGGNRRSDLPGYEPFRQITPSYCGPATVQSMLHFLSRSKPGPKDAMLANGPGPDQQVLARDEWLVTNALDGTSWGETVPSTLNAWRGTRWYAAFGTPNAGGELTKDQAMRQIQYAIDHGYPVAANVIYGPSTYTPAGFSPGTTYMHWESIIGYLDRDGERYIRLGESYGSPGHEYVPIQEIRWDDYWPAIGSWYGLVW